MVIFAENDVSKTEWQGRFSNRDHINQHCVWNMDKYDDVSTKCYEWSYSCMPSFNVDWAKPSLTLQWRHNGHDGVSNRQPHDCLLNCLFRRRSKEISKLRVIGLCAGNSPVTGEFPAQMASYAEIFPFDDVIMRHKWVITSHIEEVIIYACPPLSYTNLVRCLWHTFVRNIEICICTAWVKAIVRNMYAIFIWRIRTFYIQTHTDTLI